ncbi:MAG: methyltransferase domain-containing protein [Rhodobacteraceae bacterium]|nr:methyltransferase domain-containing protein [Paracoccaceae bacterium]
MAAPPPAPGTGSRPRVLNLGGGDRGIAIPAYYAGFEQVLVDIDPAVKPDLLIDGRELGRLEPGQADAVYCSHNLEHYHAHEVPTVLEGIMHVLKPDGFADIRVPDMGQLMAEVVRRGLDIEDVIYTAGVGPVRVRDVIYGYGPQIARSGADHYAHRTGFTEKSLAKALVLAGFGYVLRRPGRVLELSVLAFRAVPTEAQKRLLNLRRPINLLLR